MKISQEKMYKEISNDLILYLKSGEININSFINKINKDIVNLRHLLKIHFLLNKKVINFVESLSMRIRRLKTSTQHVNKVYHNKVKGRINWEQTFHERYNFNYLDNTIFSCVEKDRNFNIKENLVLKKLLNNILKIIDNELEAIDKYNWVAPWNSNNNFVNKFKKIYYRNIYLKQIDIKNNIITKRMINDTKNSRNNLYKEAAKLLSFYNKLINPSYWDEENIKAEIINLLEETFLNPKNESVLFELFWVFSIINNEKGQKANYHIIDGSKNLVASWKKDQNHYKLYHDSTGANSISFKINLNELKDSDNDYLKRKYQSEKMYNNIIRKIFDTETSNEFWQGRPDIILEKRNEKNKLLNISIFEVKNTSRKEYAKEGLKEIINYMSFIKNKNLYINSSELDNGNIQGFLLLNGVEFINKSLDNIKIINADEIV